MKNIRKAVTVMAAAGIIGGILSAASVCAADFAAASPTVNYRTDPIGIDVDGITFGWRMESNKVGAAQKAYEIEVARDGEAVWDSGRVESGISVGIPYEGPELDGAARYDWHVTVWNEDNIAARSADAHFETALKNDDDWENAQFIRAGTSSAAPIFRTERAIDGEVASARLYITALGVYSAQINGEQVYHTENGKRVYDYMNPGYGNADRSIDYETYDVTELLKNQTAAVITVTAGTGWSSGGSEGVLGADTGSPAIKAMLVINTDKGTEKIVTNTSDWKATLAGPVTGNGIYYGEDYDARRLIALGDYQSAGYDDSSWAGVSDNGHAPNILEDAFAKNESARFLRVSVSEVGPATKNDGESRLQIMELEAIDENGINRAGEAKVTASDSFNYGDQWRAENINDGDYGLTSDAGYTSNILSVSSVQSFSLKEPITVDFEFPREINLSAVRVVCRTGIASVVNGLCPNYPKKYSIQVSDDGQHWETAAERDAGDVRLPEQLASVTYSGEIRPSRGMSGRIVDEFDKEPVSAVLYTREKGTSDYPGGEIDIEDEYEGSDIFANGITIKDGQTMVVNMGQNMTAVPEISFSAASGTRLNMKFAEMLNDGSAVGDGPTQASGPKGSIYTKSLRTARSEANYTFAGTGEEAYRPSMSFFGYQYIQLKAVGGDVKITGLRSKALSSVSRQTGFIETNNSDVNRLFLNAVYGQLSNFFTIPTDCPQRDERLAWTGDEQAFARTAMYNFDSAAFLGAYQELLNDNTLRDGYPSAVLAHSGYFHHWAAGWSDAEVINAYTLYSQTGDKTALQKSWPALNAYMDYLKRNEREPYRAPKPYDQFGDWLAFQGTCYTVIADYYYGYVTSLMRDMAKALGDTENERKYSELFENQKQAFLDAHVVFTDGAKLTIKSSEGGSDGIFMAWAGKAGVIEDNSQTSLIWMLKLGWYENDAMRGAAVKMLVDNIRNEDPPVNSVRSKYGKNTLAVGFLGSNVIAPTLSDVGCSDVSYDLLLNDSMPSWLFEVKSGATTIWERWNSYDAQNGFGDAEMNSFNHFAYGSVVEWMYRYMAGITSDDGFKSIVFRPTFDTGEKYNSEERIHSVKCGYDSYYGHIASEWETDDNGSLVSFKAVVPANTSAELYLPIDEETARGFKDIPGVKYLGTESIGGNVTAKFALESGGYTFSVQNGRLIAALDSGYEADGGQWWVNLSPEEFSLESAEYTDGKLSISYTAPNGAWLIAADYNNGVLRSAKCFELNPDTGTLEIPNAEGKRLFIWEKSSQKPLVVFSGNE